MSDARATFSSIYKDHTWGGQSRSGPGSTPALMRAYLDFIKKFIKQHNVRSVVDVGCGDWAFSRTIDWSGVTYTGVDVVPELVEQLNRDFGGSHIRFLNLDLAVADLPQGDLCLIKDVLQHLPNENIMAFLEKLSQRYKYAIITNDKVHEERAGWRSLWKVERMQPNREIAVGGYRPVMLTEDPFRLKASVVMQIPFRFPGRAIFNGQLGTVLETKEVLLWRRVS